LRRNPKSTKPKSAATKGELAKWQKERRRRRFLHIGILIAILAVIGVVVWGYIDTQVKPWRQPIVKVNDQVLNMNDFVKMLRVQGVDPYYTDIETARIYVDMMVYCELMRQAAQEYGIYPEVTDEVNNQIEELKQSFEEAGQDFQQQLKELKITEADLKRWGFEWPWGVEGKPGVLTEKLREFITGDLENYPVPPEFEDELSDYYVPKNGEQVELFGILVGTKDEANEVIGGLNSGEGFSQLARVYSQYELSKQEIHLQGILVDNLETANEVMGKLAESSGDFASLVGEYSLDETSKGKDGDLNWFTYDSLERKFKGEDNRQAILEIEPNSYAIITVDDENYWVVQALEKKPAGNMGWMPEEYIRIMYGDELAEAAFGFETWPDYSKDPIPFSKWSTNGGYWVVQAIEPKNDEGEIHLGVILLDSKDEANTVINDISGGADGADFAELAKEKSLHQTSKESGGDLGWLSRDDLLTQFHFAEDALLIVKIFALDENELMPQPIWDSEMGESGGYWVVQAIEPKNDEGEIHLGVILLDSQDEANTVINDISGGADFAELAKEKSLHQASKESGGDLGWLSGEDLLTQFHFAEDALKDAPIIDDIFALGENELLPEPILDTVVSKSSGYWIIKVNNREERQISDENRAVLKGDAIGRWMEDERENSEIDDSYIDGQEGEKKLSDALALIRA
jgi:parvulin-like peptidyl-prolyl isomerase